MRLHIKCPNCGKPGVSFKLRQQSSLVTEVAYNCRNPECGCAYVAIVTADRYLRLPTFVNPKVYLPLSPIVQRNQLKAALDRLHVASVGPEGEIVGYGQAQRDIFDEAPEPNQHRQRTTTQEFKPHPLSCWPPRAVT